MLVSNIIYILHQQKHKKAVQLLKLCKNKMNNKLVKIANKYQALKFNENNYSVGGGLSNGSFASNRHQDAKYDEGKLTEGQATQIFKKATELEIEVVKTVINYAIPNMEWHHAGKLPKAYGGGMKKTYFLNATEIVDLATNWDNYFEKYQISIEAKRNAEQIKKELESKKLEFLQANAKKIERLGTKPTYFYCLYSECNGKYGWFDASKNIYNMAEYHTGWAFESQEKYQEFLNIK